MAYDFSMPFPRRFLFVFLLSTFLLFDALCGSQPFRFFGISDTLPSQSISSIAQDSHGFLWFGSQGGLIRYDGIEYTLYPSVPFSDNTLSSNLIQTIRIGRDDSVWIGTYSGLDRFDPETGRFRNYHVGNDVVASLLIDSSDRLWAGTLDGLACLNPGSPSFVSYRSENRDGRTIANNTIRDLWESPEGAIYASTYDGLYVWDPASDSFGIPPQLSADNPARSGIVYGLRMDANGFWWILKWDAGLVRVHPETGEWKLFPLEDNRGYCMETRFQDGLILVGTWGGGLQALDTATGAVRSYRQDSAYGQRLTSDIVYSLFVDRTGILWLGTNGGGLNVHDPTRAWFSAIIADPEGKHGLPAGKVNAILENPDGSLWISVVNRGLTRYFPESGELRRLVHDPRNPSSLPSNTVYALYRDSRNTLYLGTDKGLFAYDEQTGVSAPVSWYNDTLSGAQGLTVSTIGESSDGSLWIGSYDRGITRYDPSTGLLSMYMNDPSDHASLSDNLVYCMHQDSAGRMWIGTNRGLNRLDDIPRTGTGRPRFRNYRYDRSNPAGISGNTVYSIYEDESGILWFGTRSGGVSVFDPELNSFSYFISRDGLPSDTVVGVSPSIEGFLWIATQNGLVHFDKRQKTFATYKTSDGLLSQQFNTVSGATAAGYVYFGTPSGIVYCRPEDLQIASARQPSVSLVSLTVNNIRRPLTPGNREEVVFSSDERNISFYYTALDFSPLSRHAYSYMLEGYDESWQFSGERRFAVYTNLSPGRYTFRARLGGPADLQEAEPAVAPEMHESGTFSFQIQAPLFLRWYFLLVYLLLLIGLVFIIYRVRSYVALKRKVGELEETALSLKDRNDELELLSFRDPLTGIANRRYFEYSINREWAAALRGKTYLSFLMIDIDCFKLYNDTYGHQAGDSALCAVAAAVTASLFRVSDVAARYGGEEFVVVLPDTDRENARIVCDRIMSAVSEKRISFGVYETGFLTVSVGMFTSIPQAGESFVDYVRNADQALYESKRNGRNRITVFGSAGAVQQPMSLGGQA